MVGSTGAEPEPLLPGTVGEANAPLQGVRAAVDHLIAAGPIQLSVPQPLRRVLRFHGVDLPRA